MVKGSALPALSLFCCENSGDGCLHLSLSLLQSASMRHLTILWIHYAMHNIISHFRNLYFNSSVLGCLFGVVLLLFDIYILEIF